MKEKGCCLAGCSIYLLLSLLLSVYGYFFYEDDKKESVKTEQTKRGATVAKNKAKFKPSAKSIGVAKSELLGEYEVQELVLPYNYNVFGDSKLMFKAGEKVKALFYIAEDFFLSDRKTQLYPVVENARGERYTLYINRDGNFDEFLKKPLKVLNPDFHYYVGGTFRQTKDFVYGSHINDVIKKWGEYTYMRKQKDGTYKYGFHHITYAQGISRTHCVYCITDADGYVVSSYAGEESSNLFGYLFFYADILSLNIFSLDEPAMYDNRNDYFDAMDNKAAVALNYILYSLIASFLSLLVLCAVARVRLFSNNVVLAIFYTVFIILQYVLLVALMEYYHSWWMLLLIFLPGCQSLISKGCIEIAGIKYRCPECNRMNAVCFDSRHTGDVCLRSNITFGYPKRSGDIPTYRVTFTRAEEVEKEASCKYCSYVKYTTAEDNHIFTTCPNCGKPLRECAVGDDGEIGTVDFYNFKKTVNGQEVVLEFDFTYKAQCRNCKWTFQLDERHYDVRKPINSQSHSSKQSSASSGGRSQSAGFGCAHMRTGHIEGSLSGYYYCEYDYNNVSAAKYEDCCKCLRGHNCSDYKKL